jgi:hypothetical protein
MELFEPAEASLLIGLCFPWHEVGRFVLFTRSQPRLAGQRNRRKTCQHQTARRRSTRVQLLTMVRALLVHRGKRDCLGLLGTHPLLLVRLLDVLRLSLALVRVVRHALRFGLRIMLRRVVLPFARIRLEWNLRDGWVLVLHARADTAAASRGGLLRRLRTLRRGGGRLLFRRGGAGRGLLLRRGTGRRLLLGSWRSLRCGAALLRAAAGLLLARARGLLLAAAGALLAGCGGLAALGRTTRGRTLETTTIHRA